MNEASSKRWKWLVIGYGNELRGDDGAGIMVARRIAENPPPGVRSIAARQLTPELADEIAYAEHVLFVDARIPDGDGIRIVPVHPQPAAHGGMGHIGSPGGLLELCRSLFANVPSASLLTLPARDIGFHAGLSAGMHESVRAAEGIVREIIAENYAQA